MIGGLIYTIPSLFEIRFSPQINIWIYGFFQHDFGQMVRGFGFRPIVFLPHALWLAFFFVNSVIAAAALARTESKEQRSKYIFAMLWLMLVILLCQTMLHDRAQFVQEPIAKQSGLHRTARQRQRFFFAR